jgi:hypothetical protein
VRQAPAAALMSVYVLSESVCSLNKWVYICHSGKPG